MASGAVKMALMAFLIIIICAIVLVPIAIMLTSEEKEELKSTVPESERLIKKTSKTDPMEASSTPTDATTIT